MKTSLKLAICILLGGATLSIALPASALGDVAAFDDIIAARIARERARQAMYAGLQDGVVKSDASVTLRDHGPSAPTAGCGSVNIANVANSQRFGGIRNLTVIIDGPIINADNQCR